MRRLPFLLIPLMVLAGAAAQAPYYPTLPAWESQAGFKYGTGMAVVDLDRDGWPDLVVANGNDMGRQKVEAYYNRQGSFPALPDWESADAEYHGHLSAGDVDGDGWPDVAVSVFLGANRFSSKGWAKLYLNDGKGTLGKNPAWRSQDSFFTFGCALGDADGDGDLDLAVATGENYQNPPDVNRLYLNQGGTLGALPAWQSAVNDHSMGVVFADVDDDGDLDLVFAGWSTPSSVYLNRGGGAFPTQPDWKPTDNSTSIMAAAGDLDGDGLPELIFADNNQLGGTGRYKFYRNSPQGIATTASWSSSFNGYGAAVALADLDQDGRLDLAAGAWWDQVRIYRNRGTTLPATQDWISAIPTTSAKPVPEKLVFRDTSRAGLYRHAEAFAGDGKRHGFTLRRVPIEAFLRVEADGVVLGAGQWCADPDVGWVSLAAAPAASLRVEVLLSHMPALAVSNWERMQGNYLFRRDAEILFDLAWVFPWIDLNLGMLPFVGIARNLKPTAFLGSLEARLLRPDGNLAQQVANPLALGAQGSGLFWGWFPVDWTLQPGLHAIQLRAVSGGAVRCLHEAPFDLPAPKPMFR